MLVFPVSRWCYWRAGLKHRTPRRARTGQMSLCCSVPPAWEWSTAGFHLGYSLGGFISVLRPRDGDRVSRLGEVK